MKKIFEEDGSPAYLIAEIGVNHNGSLELALESIKAAKAAGADAVKFQTFKTENLVTKYAQMAEYQTENLNVSTSQSQFEMLKKIELSFNDFIILQKKCEELDIDFLSTPFDDESAEFLHSINIDAFKIGSGDMNNIPLLKRINTYKTPILLSTGMATLEEVQESLEVITSPVALLHCTSDYPAPLEDVNLFAMKTMEKEFGTPVGYSDHTDGIQVSVAAISLGARIIEKHFTLDKSLPGPDHKASMSPEEFEYLVRSIRNVEIALGDGVKRCMPSEENTRLVARKSVVAAREIRSGSFIAAEDLKIKRPGSGLAPKYMDGLIGKKARYNIDVDQLILWDDVE
ncbi:N-acetylneuraminate synthase [Paenibacillus azoreducens]|uniref:N-acetylneuraminate synthase n=1 Tax=Paenibacillus azoreducens TaxID=116718 RepID=UPI0039F454B0